MFKVWGHPIFIGSIVLVSIVYRIFKLLRLDNSGFDLDQPFSYQFSPWTVAPLTQNEDDKWSRTTNDLHYSYFHNGDDICLSSNFRSVKSPVTTSQVCEDRFPSDINQSLSLAPSFPDESWLMRHESWFVKMARVGPTHNRSLSSSHPAAFTTIFKTRTHQLMWRMAERKSFFWVGDDSCVFISGCLHRLCFTPPRVCLLVKRVTQQPGAQGGCQNFKDVKLRVSFISIWICIISLTYSNSKIC